MERRAMGARIEGLYAKYAAEDPEKVTIEPYIINDVLCFYV